MRKLIAAFVLGTFLVTIGIGCGSPSTPAPKTGDKKAGEEQKEKKPGT